MARRIAFANAGSFRYWQCNNSPRLIIYTLKEERRKRVVIRSLRYSSDPQSSEKTKRWRGQMRPPADGEVRPGTEPICQIGQSIGLCEWQARHDSADQSHRRALRKCSFRLILTCVLSCREIQPARLELTPELRASYN